MPKYDKLIRDRIPEILDSEKLEYTVRTVDGDDFKSYAHQKLLEEVNEFLIEPSIEELSDIQEVMTTLLDIYGWSQEDLNSKALAKRKERGSFYKRLVLEEIISCSSE